MFTMWPKEVRSDLRAGIKAKNQGDLGMSERFLRRYDYPPCPFCIRLNLPRYLFAEPSRPRRPCRWNASARIRT